jgi:hypothetical protein
MYRLHEITNKCMENIVYLQQTPLESRKSSANIISCVVTKHVRKLSQTGFCETLHSHGQMTPGHWYKVGLEYS